MKTFKISKTIEIECESKSSKMGFNHIARLKINGLEIRKDIINYYNRTWESFEYESVILKILVNANYSKTEIDKLMKECRLI